MVGYFLMNPTAASKRLSSDFPTFFGMLGRSVINSSGLFVRRGGQIACAQKSSTNFIFLEDTSTVRMVVLSDDAPHLTY